MRPLVRDGGVRKRNYPQDRCKPGTPPAERILRYAEKTASGCWIWRGSIDRKVEEGYGQITIDYKVYKAHRVSYEAFVGPIPEGMHLDHLCRVRACVNPAHLEPVTALENTRRSPITHGNETHCPQDHPYDEANTYHYRGRRYCRTCQRARAKAAPKRTPTAEELAERRAYRRAYRAMTPEERQARKDAGLPVVDLDAYLRERAAA